MKRVLLTGATGFIGRHAIALLVDRGFEVHAVSSRQMAVPEGVHSHRTDLLDSKETASLMAEIRPTHLLHFAWYAEPGKFWRSPENFRWLEASIALLRHFQEAGGQRVVMAGTCAEYDWDYGYCSEAVTPRRPATTYGVCKNALQETLRAYCAEEKLSCAWGRIFFLYGSDEHPARLVSSVITSLLRGEVARCTHGNQLRDFMHVEDVASAFVALLDSAVEGPVNIASGRPAPLREIVLAAADYIGARERVQFGAIPAPENEPPLLVGDNRRLSNEVCWNQQRDLRVGIEQTVDWWQRNLEAN
jgi:nucleoside-diphosphate-sugar epimerase